MKIEYLFFIPPLVLVFFIIYNVIHKIWYRKNYMTYTGQYPPYWHKCWDCKKVEGTMLTHYTFWHGKVCKCSECSVKSYKKSEKK